MPNCKSVYEPREDSTMLENHVRQYAHGKVLDIGTGSGIQAIAAAHNKNVSSVLATDIQKGVIGYCRKCIRNKKIRFLQSDLFKKIKGQFDTIIFNPPYLPQELKLKDLTIEGGKKGYEIVERFLNEVNGFLKKDGIILMVFSSLTRKSKVDEFIKNNLLEFEELEKMHIFFEDIYAYKLGKSDLLKRLEAKGITNVKYLAKGHRGFIFTGLCKGKKVAIKVKNPKSGAFGRMKIEAAWLKRLRKMDIAPKLVFAEDDCFAYEFIEGDFIVDYLRKSDRKGAKKILVKVLWQMHALDKMHIDKEEMHHPVKHLIVREGKPFLIDFERAHYSQSPKNVTQFCQFIAGGNLSNILKSRGMIIGKDRMIKLAKIYKSKQNKANLEKIINLI